MKDSLHIPLQATSPMLSVWLGFVMIVSPVVVAGESSRAESVLVKHWVAESGMSRGVCSVLGCEDGKVALELARQAEFLIHVWESRPSAVVVARRLLDDEGLHGRRVIVERGSLGRLPYADNTIDLILAAHLTDRQLDELPVSEVLRVLRPRGKAVVGRSSGLHRADNQLTRSRLEQWLETAQVAERGVREDGTGFRAQLTKPPLQGVDDWSHWEHGVDNNPVSTDEMIKPPYMTQWLGLPYYIPIPAITTASAGRLFIAIGHIAHHRREEPWLNTLMARNGYNGTVLWKRKLPDGYLAHRSAFVAMPDTFYMISADGNGCSLLDPETGEEKDRIRVPGLRGEWKWIALQDGVLFALVGKEKDRPETTIVRSQTPSWSWSAIGPGYYEPRIPWGFGQTLLAYSIGERKVLWRHEEDKPIDSRAMVMGGGHVFYYGPDTHIGCLDAQSGKLCWTNADPQIRELIEEPGKKLQSTPGFRTMCYALYTPKAVVYEAQTRMNVLAVSPEDGRLLWYRKKTTSNPNVIYVDGRVLVGIGEHGDTLALDPLTGETVEDLQFRKRSCARLTATPDSLFCRVSPEGFLRYDRASKKVFLNSAFRPSCNDGAIGANGLLYVGPWQCDCNLQLIGRIALCSAGDFKFDHQATEAKRLETGEGDITRVVPLDVSDRDWPTYRGNTARSASTSATVPEKVSQTWEYRPDDVTELTAPTATGGLIFLCGNDGKVRALGAATGTLKWSFLTAGPIAQPPTIWNGRAYVGSADGYIYTLEAATGRLLWRFRAAPVERKIIVYGSLCSTWPVNTGVLVKDGVAYAAAGIIDYDGTYVYALDAITGKIKWQNTTSGTLDPTLRKGVSAQGFLTIADGRLWMAGGNLVSPAGYDLDTGEYVGEKLGNRSRRVRISQGEEIGLLNDNYLILGGRLRYSSRRNVVNANNFVAIPTQRSRYVDKPMTVNEGRIPPAWNEDMIAFVNGRHSMPLCCSIDAMVSHVTQGNRKSKLERLWRAEDLDDDDTVSLAVAPNAIVAVYSSYKFRTRQPEPDWRVCCLSPEDGRKLWDQELPMVAPIGPFGERKHLHLPSPALPGGLLIDRDGRVIVVLENGNVFCYGPE